jgi:hypothetical protein
MLSLHCEDKARLFLAHETASAAFEDARIRLTAQLDTASYEEFDRLALAVRIAFDAVENARAALNQHITEHNCLVFVDQVPA